ncbi:uncharacterized protein [Miscanthus floridulus]|uniref:uncharacterized protein n=1 Tax=Miscanthus floridulus TaxID=154761 RepID=UPI0034575FD0
MTIFFVLFAPLCGGTLVLILALGLAFASASVEALWEQHSPDASGKGLWSQAIWARTPVIRPATAPRVRFTTPRDGPTEVCVAYHHCHLMDAIIMLRLTLAVDDSMSVLVWPEPLAYRRLVWSRRQSSDLTTFEFALAEQHRAGVHAPRRSPRAAPLGPSRSSVACGSGRDASFPPEGGGRAPPRADLLGPGGNSYSSRPRLHRRRRFHPAAVLSSRSIPWRPLPQPHGSGGAPSSTPSGPGDEPHQGQWRRGFPLPAAAAASPSPRWRPLQGTGIRAAASDEPSRSSVSFFSALLLCAINRYRLCFLRFSLGLCVHPAFCVHAYLLRSPFRPSGERLQLACRREPPSAGRWCWFSLDSGAVPQSKNNSLSVTLPGEEKSVIAHR